MFGSPRTAAGLCSYESQESYPMTTLPTTTPIRLPRPAGATPLALPGTLVGAQGGANAFQMNGADVWRVIRSNIWLILAMLVLSTGAGFVLNWYLNKYHSSYT